MEGIERPKPYGSIIVQVCRNIHLKKKKEERKMVERKRRRKKRNVFLCTADLELRRRRCLVHASQEEDELVSQKQFYFQDQVFVQE